jgi:hypothetical protein
MLSRKQTQNLLSADKIRYNFFVETLRSHASSALVLGVGQAHLQSASTRAPGCLEIAAFFFEMVLYMIPECQKPAEMLSRHDSSTGTLVLGGVGGLPQVG